MGNDILGSFRRRVSQGPEDLASLAQMWLDTRLAAWEYVSPTAECDHARRILLRLAVRG